MNIFEFTVKKHDINNDIIYIKTVNIIYDEIKNLQENWTLLTFL